MNEQIRLFERSTAVGIDHAEIGSHEQFTALFERAQEVRMLSDPLEVRQVRHGWVWCHARRAVTWPRGGAREECVPCSPMSDTAEKLLLVDDSPTNLQVLVQALGGLGHELLIARSGEEAIEVARQAAPALILLDVMMPPGIDGFETCRRLKQDPHTQDAVVIFLSARDDVDARLEGFDHGAVDYIAKPFQVEEVVARVEAHLQTGRRFQDLSRRYVELLEERSGGSGTANATSEEDLPGQIGSLIAAGEGDSVEFKSTIRCNLHTGKPDKAIENAWLKTVVAFMNSEGGTLLVGVEDDGNVLGLADDGFDNDDKLLLHVGNLLTRCIGSEFSPFVDFRLVPIGAEGTSVLVVRCVEASRPAFLKRGTDEDFYIRVGPGSRKLNAREVLEYLEARPTA